MSHIPSYRSIMNSTHEHSVEITFKQTPDSQTLQNIFLEAVVASQTTTSPKPDILKLETKDTLCRAVFTNSVAASNMKNNISRLTQERFPKHIQRQLDIRTHTETNSYPKQKVA